MGNSLCTCKETAAVTPGALGAGARRKKRAAADKNAAIVPVDTADDDIDAWGEKKKKEVMMKKSEVLVKVVMTRKEAAELMAKLQEDAAERDQSAGVTMSPCRVDAWRPRLATIPENYCRY